MWGELRENKGYSGKVCYVDSSGCHLWAGKFSPVIKSLSLLLGKCGAGRELFWH